MAVFFWTVYSLGLRLNEAIHLQVGDVDAQRGLVHVHLTETAEADARQVVEKLFRRK